MKRWERVAYIFILCVLTTAVSPLAIWFGKELSLTSLNKKDLIVSGTLAIGTIIVFLTTASRFSCRPKKEQAFWAAILTMLQSYIFLHFTDHDHTGTLEMLLGGLIGTTLHACYIAVITRGEPERQQPAPQEDALFLGGVWYVLANKDGRPAKDKEKE